MSKILQKMILKKKNFNNLKNNPRDNKNREDNNSIWIAGKNPCLTILKKNSRQIFEIIVTKNNYNFICEYLLNNSLKTHLKNIKIVENIFFNNIFSNDFVHQGIALRANKINIKNQFELLEELNLINQKTFLPDLLILDQVTDPQNVGAIIRSAVAFNFKKIIFCERNSAKESSSMIKASAGNTEFAEFYYATNINNLLEKLKKIGYWCVGLAGEGKINQKGIAQYKNIALVVGSEGDGIRNLVKKNCDLLVRIDTNSEVESLNVSVATAIALNEIYLNKNV